MQIVFVTPKFIPNDETGGAAIYNYSAIRRLLALGHQVTLIHFGCLDLNPVYPKAAEYLETLGVKIVSFSRGEVSATQKSGLLPSIRTTFPTIELAQNLSNYLGTTKTDLVFAFGDDALAALKDVSRIPVAAQLADPMHLIQQIRWEYDIFWGYPFGLNLETAKWPWRVFLSTSSFLPRHLAYPRHLKSILQNVSLLVTATPQHTAYYEALSQQKCYFTPIPIPDSFGKNWKEKRAAYPHYGSFGREKAKILWVGKLGNSENRYAVLFFAREIYPELVRQIGEQNFEIHFVGEAANCPSELIQLAKIHTNIILRGHVHEIDPEWLSSDIFLVTNTTRIGIRTRILSAFSAGSCVVAHTANAAGIPDLKHGKNILLGKNAIEIAACVKQALADAELRSQISSAGRQIYEARYELSVAAQGLVDLFEQTVKQGAAEK